MKKFYIPILAAVLVLTSSSTQAQVFNSITDGNPSNYTLDDGRFWQGGVAPGNPCSGCTINIWSQVIMGHNGMSTFPPNNGPWLDHVILDGATLRVEANVQVDTYLSLTNASSIVIAAGSTHAVTVYLNDQVDMDASSMIQIGNSNSWIDATNSVFPNSPLKGPYQDFANLPNIDPGVYSILSSPIGGYNYSMTLNEFANGTFLNNFNQYSINCSGGPGFCTGGIISGPAITGPTPTPPPDYGIIFNSSTTLPVVLVQLLASKNDDGSVKVSWATSQETNAGYYDIERSGDQTNFTKIGTVKAKGNSQITTNYSFVDQLPLDGNDYYRLKMVDLDGKYVYSKTVSVTTQNDGRPLVIYSNPFSDMIRLKVNVNRAQNLTMTVSDMLGKTYINQSYFAQSGDNFVNLPTSITSHGMYVLRIHGDSYDQTVKLQKQ